MKIAPDETLKRKYIEKYADCQESLPDAEIEKFRAYVEEGVQNDWVEALDAKAYGCYGGNKIFECDWNASLECLLKLVDLAGDPFYYNTIGYIYYYGRCNNGEPEYDKAFQYFAVGAAHGVFESMYKVADMFIAGKGCLKNPAAGAKIILSLYSDNRDIFCGGGYDGKFADVALRVGGLFENGIGVDKDIESAYNFYLEAKLAIDMRMSEHDYYGDKKVSRNIEDAIARVRKNLPEDYFADEVTLEAPVPIGMLMGKSAGIDLSLDVCSRGYKLHAKGWASEDTNAQALFNMPELNFCHLINETELILPSSTEILTDISDMPYNAFVTGILYDEDADVWQFMCGERAMLAIKTEGFIFTNPD